MKRPSLRAAPSIAAALVLTVSCLHPSTNIARPTPEGRFALGLHKGFDEDWAAVMDPTTKRVETLTGSASLVVETLVRAYAMAPYTLVGRWGVLSHWDLGLALGVETGIDTRLALWQDPSERAIVLTGDAYIGGREEVHSRLLWFEPISKRLSFVSGGGVSNGKYHFLESAKAHSLGQRREGRVDVLLGIELREPDAQFVIALNGYRVVAHGLLVDRPAPTGGVYVEPTLPEQALWLSFSVETLVGF